MSEGYTTEYGDSLAIKISTLTQENETLTGQLKQAMQDIREYKISIEEKEIDLAENDIQSDNTEDCRRSLYFAITELEEVERGEISLTDKLFDLRMRHCRFL